MKTKILLVIVALLSVAVGGCSRTVAIDLKLVEPCDQKNQALNGVSSFVISSSGSQADDNVSFNKDEGPSPLNVGLGDVTITAQAFADDVSQAGASGTLPQAIGRTMPISVTEATQDIQSMVLTGELDSFGKTTAEDGSCTQMTDGAAVQGRHGHTATFVPGLNKVLIVGGAVFNADGSEGFLDTAELYDPATGKFQALPPLDQGRAYHQATALPDGRVLITGGFGRVSGHLSALQTAFVFDPALGENTPYHGFVMKQARAHHTATLMQGAGLVVIMGGCVGQTEDDNCTTTGAGAGAHGDSTQVFGTDNQPHPLVTELFDVTQATGAAATTVAADGLTFGRAFHTATSLENEANTILVVAGGTNSAGPVADIEIFRASGGALSHVAGGAQLAGFPTGKVPVRAAAVAIDAQRVLFIGGQTAAPNGTPSGPGSADVFFFSTSTGVDQTPLQLFGKAGRVGHVATQLRDGSILVIGGALTAGPPGPNGEALPPPTAEVLRPGAGTGLLTPEPLAGPPLAQARDHAAMAVLPTNQVLYTGGHTTVGTPLTTSNSAEIYFGP